MQIPYTQPALSGKELEYVTLALQSGRLSGDGPFTKKCHALLQKQLNGSKTLLTHSATAALEMSAILADLKPGDEVIMPSFTFVSTANAVVLRGAIPVFVDIRPDTLNIDERLVEAAISNKTRAIFAVHYAGIACAMDELSALARQYNLLLIEDAAQGAGAFYKGSPLGAIGDLGCLSFHETKNIVSGEGGALIVNNKDMEVRSEIIREKGTNRSAFLRGDVDKYSWVDLGSSYLPNELTAACLAAQLEQMEHINASRKSVWRGYHSLLEDAEEKGLLRRPVVPDYADHNAHIYYVLLNGEDVCLRAQSALRGAGVQAVSHYVPLHSSIAGRKYGRAGTSMNVTDDLPARLLRLPVWVGLGDVSVEQIVASLIRELNVA